MGIRWTDKTFMFFTVLICLISALTSRPGLAQVNFEPRNDHVVSLDGIMAPGLEMVFAEVVYLGANLLDPICLLRFPNGEYAPVKEAVEVQPTIFGDRRFHITMPMNHFDGSDVCQLRFVAIRIWFSETDQITHHTKHTFVALLPLGSRLGAEEARSIGEVKHITCEGSGALACGFMVGGNARFGVSVPSGGVTVSNLEIKSES